MSSPKVPADFKAVVPSPTSTLCGKFVSALLKFPAYFYAWFSWAFNSSGNITLAFRQQFIPSGDLIFSASGLLETTHRLLCDGREVSQTTYPDLYTAIGVTYGAAAAGNFKLPDYRAKFPVGVGVFAGGASVALGGAVGEDKVSLTQAQMPPHTHDLKLFNDELARSSGNACLNDTDNGGSSSATAKTVTTESTGGAGSPAAVEAHNNIPPAVGVYIYIAT